MRYAVEFLYLDVTNKEQKGMCTLPNGYRPVKDGVCMAEDICLDISVFPNRVKFMCVESDDVGINAEEFAVLARKA